MYVPSVSRVLAIGCVTGTRRLDCGLLGQGIAKTDRESGRSFHWFLLRRGEGYGWRRVRFVGEYDSFVHCAERGDEEHQESLVVSNGVPCGPLHEIEGLFHER